MYFHSLKSDLERPARLNNPFGYEPHPLCQMAARQVRAYVESQPLLIEDARRGKMMGVLVVEREDAEGAALKGDPQRPGGGDPRRPGEGSPRGPLGFLAAYSGLLAGRNDWEYFVPPVFDAQQPEGHFKQTERVISEINAQVADLAAMEAPPLQQIEELKRQRKQLSEELQAWLFRQYLMVNAQGERKDLIGIWRDYHQSEKIRRQYPLPPGGSGDCCAPKLLQYAFLHGLRPLAIAEFWMGESPRGEVRHDGQYYPACRGKCLPILTFMLQGVVDCREGIAAPKDLEPKVLYEDEAVLVIEKPSGLLAVPGRGQEPSVESLLAERYGQVWMPHRLDMDTSGLMVVARTEQAYKHLQRQFYARTIYKKYIALLDVATSDRNLQPGQQGTISLPLRPDPLDRPRQVVDHLHGKQAVTDYRLLPYTGKAPIPATQGLLAELEPHTGRTHQLRMHCAHHEGLGTPIVGDALYGRKAHRLCLHAAVLSFDHPTTGERMTFETDPDF
ncbi:MAG: RluA family pseudouridine synthase [Prevotella sp.]|nr:RluA family pseudouridine synthase [Prevotella sp.]